MNPKPAQRRVMTVTEDSGGRMDVYLSERLELSRSQVRRLLDGGLVLVNEALVKAGYKLREGDEIRVTQPMEPEHRLEPQPIPLEIIYEEEELAVINKP